MLAYACSGTTLCNTLWWMEHICGFHENLKSTTIDFTSFSSKESSFIDGIEYKVLCVETAAGVASIQLAK